MKTTTAQGPPFTSGSECRMARFVPRALRPWCLFAAMLVFALGSRSVALAQQSICAQVKIEILQELTLEREAFEARMTINNGVAGVPLDNLSVDVSFADKDGNPVRVTSDPNDLSAKFYIRLQTGSSIPTTVPGETTAKILWLIIPARGAGGANPQGELYSVGAKLTYRAAGQNQEVQVSPDTIYVKPMPALTLDYFLPYEVYGDDPFTENVVEPVVPFNLGVRVKNDGYGPARKLKIESAQPRIIENKLGLLVDFRIEGSEVNGQPATPSLLCDFGDIPANRSGVARWSMISTLSGRFVDFTANYTHADELGGQLTSLIATNPRTHLLVRDVLVDLPGRDLVRDFLAKDGDVLRVYESQNADTVVNDVSGGCSVSGSGGRYTLSTAPFAGFGFVKLADPERGRQGLRSATRADGKALSSANAWLSKTWIRDAQRWDYYMNLFDVNNAAGLAYVLQYESLPGQSNHPPVMDPINNWTIHVGNRLGFPITALDPEGDLLTYTLLSGPTNATLNPTTGFFEWRPSRLQSPSTQVIMVQATDNGTPPQSAVAQFTITVNPIYGFQLTLGSTNILAGESNAVPVVLKSDVDLTNVTFVLTLPSTGSLTNLALQALAPEVFSYGVTPMGVGVYTLNLEVDPLRIQYATRTLGMLSFRSLPEEHSGIVPLATTNLAARNQRGAAVTNGLTQSGQVIVVGREPLLVANRDETLTLYGRPGASYVVQEKTNLWAPTPWNHMLRLPLSDRFLTFPASVRTPNMFYQAYEFQTDQPFLEWSVGAWPRPLIIYGKPGDTYSLEATAALGSVASWTEVTNFSMTNSWHRIPQTPADTSNKFFRVR